MNIPLILESRYSGTSWVLAGDSYDGLDWFSESPKPTEEELQDLWPQVQYEHEYSIVEGERARAYREISDPIFFEWQRGDATEAEWLAAVQAVKNAHPYPKAP